MISNYLLISSTNTQKCLIHKIIVFLSCLLAWRLALMWPPVTGCCVSWPQAGCCVVNGNVLRAV